MKEATDVLKIVGIVLLALFVLAVGVPLVLAAAGVALGVLGILIALAIALIKIAIVWNFFFCWGWFVPISNHFTSAL